MKPGIVVVAELTGPVAERIHEAQERYVLAREELASAWIAAPIACVFPIVTAAARMMEEKHWITDICGGYLSAVAVSSVPLAVYELVR